MTSFPGILHNLSSGAAFGLGARCSSVVRAFAHGAMGHQIDPSLSYFSLHDWLNKSRGMCYPVCGMMHIKEPLLLIGKSSPCGGSGFPLSLSERSFAICLTPYNRKLNVLSASLSKTLPSFLCIWCVLVQTGLIRIYAHWLAVCQR